MHGEGDGREGSRRAGSPHRMFILTPMPEEAAALAEDLGGHSWLEAAGARFCVGSGPYRAVVVGISGMGKVAAAVAAQYACDRWQPWLLLVSGVAGGVQPDTGVGDLVVPSEAIQHDYDARPFSPARSLIPHLGPAPLEPDHQASALTAAACESYLASPAGSQARDMGLRQDAARVISGAALTGDQVITTGPAKQELVCAFPAGLCADMETAALAQVARQNGAAIRMISDTAENVDADAVFEYLATGAAQALSAITRETIDRLLDREPQTPAGQAWAGARRRQFRLLRLRMGRGIPCGYTGPRSSRTSAQISQSRCMRWMRSSPRTGWRCSACSTFSSCTRGRSRCH